MHTQDDKTEIRPENDVTKLSVPQVILLCILITVISSVATAIVVVQLVATIPGETVFQTIERVTETVVERPVTVEQPKTIVIKEGDLVAKAIAENNNSALAVYSGDESTDVVSLGHGFVVGDDLLIMRAMETPAAPVEAGLHRLGTFGSAKFSLWQTQNPGDVFEGKQTVRFAVGDPQVGQTAVYLSGDGSIVRGSISGVSGTGLEFTGESQLGDIGLIIDIGGAVIGLWTGSEIIRSTGVDTQISQLTLNPLQTVPAETPEQEEELPTNPDDVKPTDKKSACELIGGSFNEYSECSGIDSDQCQVLGGEFQECASACRHDPDAEICTLQCVIYCQL